MPKRTASGRNKYEDAIWIDDDSDEDDGELSYTDGESESDSDSDAGEGHDIGDDDALRPREKGVEDDLERLAPDETMKSDSEEDAALELEDETRRRRTPSASPPRRGNVLVDLLADTRPEAPDQSHFNSLPRDIKYLILSFLDQDPHSWYKAFNQGSAAEIDWQRRCNAMGSLRKSPHCRTWRETFIRQIQKHCLECLRTCKVSFGHIVPGGPDWLVVCEDCQKLPGPWQTLAEAEAYRRACNPSIVKSLPHRAQRITGRRGGRKWEKLYLASAVQPDPYEGVSLSLGTVSQALKNPAKVQHLIARGLLTAEELEKFQKYAARMRSAMSTEIPSRRLLNMLAIMAQLVVPSVPLAQACEDAKKYLVRLRTAVAEVEQRQAEEPGLERKDTTLLFGIRPDVKNRRSWIDAIILGEATIREYLVVLQDDKDAFISSDPTQRHKERRTSRKNAINWFNRSEGRMPSKKMNKKRKLDPSTADKQMKRDARPRKVVPRVPRCQKSCGAAAAKACSHNCCGICCPGPCERHKKRQKIALYAAKKEEMDD